MKMVKKILLGLVATAAVIGFAGCKQVDDVNEAITGKNNDYAVDYENTSSDIYRAYKSTSLKHAGALVRVKFDSKDVGYSKMGIIFDLHDNADDKNAKDFCIIGLGTQADKNFYVSTFTNVTDLQADNFGTKLADNPAKEVEHVALGSEALKVPVNADGSVVYYVYFKAQLDGSYDYAILNLTEEQASSFDISKEVTEASIPAGAKLAVGSIEKAFTAVEKENDIPQNQLAVYAMVTPKQTLKGTWKYYGMYLDAEEITE